MKIVLLAALGITPVQIPMMPLVSIQPKPLVRPFKTLNLPSPIIPQVRLTFSAPKAKPVKPVSVKAPAKSTKTKKVKVKKRKKIKDKDNWDDLFDGRRKRSGRQTLPEDDLIRDIGVPKD